MRVLKCSSIADAYKKGVEHVIRNGVYKKIHGTDVLQSDPVTLDIKIDNQYDWSDLCPLKERASVAYVEEFLNPDRGEQPYTYGERLCDYNGVNQLDEISKKLIAEYNSRQAIAVIWNPNKDNEMETPPCFQFMQVFSNSESKLNAVFLFRSNDWYQALMSNLQGLKLALSNISYKTGFLITDMSLIAVCPHIYWYSVNECKRKWNIL